MKKILSLLSVLTISGTVVPTTIAASPYQKEENIKNSDIIYQQTNNLEILNRNKRDILSLNIPEVQQLGSVWCGPAAAESILRYMGVTWEDVINGERVNTLHYHNFQNYLASLMGSNVVRELENSISGTYPPNFLEVLNTFINRYVRPYIHSSLDRNFYGTTVLERGYTNLELFYNYVRNSLNNNVPVALAFSGTLPGWSERENQINHFIVIYQMTEVQNNNFGSVNYTYMDPGNGLNRGVFTGEDLTTNLTQGRTESVLFHHDSNITEWNTNNSTIALETLEEVMEIDYSGIRCSITNQASQRKKRSNENKIQCSNEKKFYYNDENKKDILYNPSYEWTAAICKQANPSYCSQNHNKIYLINLGKINPLNFNKIDILFDNIDGVYTKISWGNDPYIGTKITDFFKNNFIKDIIVNKKVTNSEVAEYANHDLRYIEPSGLMAWIRVGLTFYWEDNNYYLQLLINNHVEIWWPHTSGGAFWLGIGKGIKLYN